MPYLRRLESLFPAAVTFVLWYKKRRSGNSRDLIHRFYVPGGIFFIATVNTLVYCIKTYLKFRQSQVWQKKKRICCVSAQATEFVITITENNTSQYNNTNNNGKKCKLCWWLFCSKFKFFELNIFRALPTPNKWKKILLTAKKKKKELCMIDP